MLGGLDRLLGVVERALEVVAAAGDIGQDHQARRNALAQHGAAQRDGFERGGLGSSDVAHEKMRVGGRRAGCHVGTLQSSGMARRMYEAQGFRYLFRYRAFRG